MKNPLVWLLGLLVFAGTAGGETWDAVFENPGRFDLLEIDMGGSPQGLVSMTIRLEGWSLPRIMECEFSTDNPYRVRQNDLLVNIKEQEVLFHSLEYTPQCWPIMEGVLWEWTLSIAAGDDLSFLEDGAVSVIPTWYLAAGDPCGGGSGACSGVQGPSVSLTTLTVEVEFDGGLDNGSLTWDALKSCYY